MHLHTYAFTFAAKFLNLFDMSKSIDKFPVVYKTIWEVVDSHWSCVCHEMIGFGGMITVLDNFKVCLNDYLWTYGFDIHQTINYCIAKNGFFELQYRVYGRQIICYIKPLNVMNKIPHLEINCIPSQLNTSKVTGVVSQLASVAEQAPNYDNVTIDQMRGNPLYQRVDDIDKIGLAQKRLVESTDIVRSRARTIRAYNDAAQKLKKPAN